MVHSVIIVGGGFSGLVLANCFLQDGTDFLLLEKNDRLGKKILATGNGRGNVSNEDLSLSHYHGQDETFSEYAIKNFDNGLIGRFFKEKGIILTSENGKMYPLSKQANSILDALRLFDAENKCLTSKSVDDVNFDKKKGCFVLNVGKEKYFAEKVVLCVGGKSAPHFGTDGESYKFAQKFGHKITALYPSLVQLTAKKEDIKGLKGIKENALVEAYSGEKLLSKLEGDILFTDNGVSGNTVFYLSSYLSGKKEPWLKVNFLIGVNDEDCKNSLLMRRLAYPRLQTESFLSGIVHSTISRKIVKEVLPSERLYYNNITENDIDKLIFAVKNYKISIMGDTGFKNSQVTKGGIDTRDVDNKTMQSKLQKGLYFCGEVLDVDGDCGGYNLQWAFSSAMCAYRSIKGEK